MGYQLTTLGLAPFLIRQGRRVRRVTPRLPEAMGERSGTVGAGPPLRLLIVGDSAAAGVGVATQEQALAGQLVASLGADFTVTWQVTAQTGHRTQDVIAHLEHLPPASFDVVVTSIGVNEATGRTSARQFVALQQQLIRLLQSKFHARHILLSSVPPMHLFPALPQPLRWYLGLGAKRLNYALARSVKGDQRCAFVLLDFPMEAAYMAADGFHPSALGYARWGQEVGKIIRRRLAAEVN